MTPPSPETRPRPAPQLYLVSPLLQRAGAIEPLLAALKSGPFAAVLLRIEGEDERSLINVVKAVTPPIQQAGIAVILDGHAGIVAKSGADGAHLTGIEAFLEAARTLKPERIAGVGSLSTRHDAMVAAENGADYVLFGEPDAEDRRPAFDTLLERVGWWAEVFETPCVALAASHAEIAPLVHAGADFVAAGDFLFADPRGVEAAVRDAVRALEQTEPVP